MSSPEGKREYFYDRAGRLIIEKFNGEIDVEYKYGYLDKVIEVNRRGKITKFAYDGFGMLAQKTFHDGSTEVWVWDGLALIRRGSDIYVNEPHVSGGVPILSKTDEGVRYHEHDFLGTTLWSTDTKGNLVKDYQDTTIFGEGSIQKDRSARFTGKPYDEDLQAYVFPYRNYDASTARWRSSDPAGYPDGVNNQFYAAVPTLESDVSRLWIIAYPDITAVGSGAIVLSDINSTVSVELSGFVRVRIVRGEGDIGSRTFNFETLVSGSNNISSRDAATVSILSSENLYETTVEGIGLVTTLGVGAYTHSFSISGISATGSFSI